jgi:hypothetical protein
MNRIHMIIAISKTTINVPIAKVPTKFMFVIHHPIAALPANDLANGMVPYGGTLLAQLAVLAATPVDLAMRN